MKFNMIFSICPADHVQKIVNAAKKAGATGATILSARGTGHKEAKTFFGLTLDAPQEAVVMLVLREKCRVVMQAIKMAGGMEEPGHGICFSLAVEDVEGLESQFCILKKESGINDADGEIEKRR